MAGEAKVTRVEATVLDRPKAEQYILDKTGTACVGSVEDWFIAAQDKDCPHVNVVFHRNMVLEAGKFVNMFGR
jgi:hypothetical protein